MNFSDMNREIIFPVELFAAFTTGNRLNFPMDGVCVSVESTLVFGLEVAFLTVKCYTPMVSEDVSHQQFPLIECL